MSENRGSIMAECADCGRTLSEMARFCPTCGTAVAVQAPDSAPAAPPVSETESAVAPVVAAASPEPPTPLVTAEPDLAQPDPAVIETPVGDVASPVPDPAVQAPTGPAGAPGAQAACPVCGALAPAGDLFCGDCGAPVGQAAVAAAPIAPTPALAPALAPMPAPGAPGGVTPAAYQPRTGIEDYLAFRALWVTTHAAALFWIAEGANLVYWILHYVVTGRWNGAQGFFWSAAGFVLFAVIIRIATEAAVAAARAAGGTSARD